MPFLKQALPLDLCKPGLSSAALCQLPCQSALGSAPCLPHCVPSPRRLMPSLRRSMGAENVADKQLTESLGLCMAVAIPVNFQMSRANAFPSSGAANTPSTQRGLTLHFGAGDNVLPLARASRSFCGPSAWLQEDSPILPSLPCCLSFGASLHLAPC